MSRCSEHRICNHWRSTISATVACLSCWSAVPSVTAQQSESTFLVALLPVSPLTAVPIRGATGVRTNRQALAERQIDPMLTPHRLPTNAEAWEQFEVDYSPPQQSSSSIKRRIESAKLGLDTALFAVDHFVKNVESQADFTYDQGGLRRTPAIALEDLRKSPRVKLDLEMWQGCRPYAGVRLIIPFGN